MRNYASIIGLALGLAAAAAIEAGAADGIFCAPYASSGIGNPPVICRLDTEMPSGCMGLYWCPDPINDLVPIPCDGPNCD